MSAIVIPVLAAIAASVLAFAASGAGAADTDLRIRLWSDGRDASAADRTWTLECGPARGSLPRSATACSRLTKMERPFAPLRKDLQCTQIYGGPTEALVTGTYRGARVSLLLHRRDGCGIGQWQRIAFLTPGYGTFGPS